MEIFLYKMENSEKEKISEEKNEKNEKTVGKTLLKKKRGKEKEDSKKEENEEIEEQDLEINKIPEEKVAYLREEIDDDMEKEAGGKNTFINYKMNTSTLGSTIYAVKSFYKDDVEEDENLHTDLFSGVEKYINEISTIIIPRLLGINKSMIKKVVAGHEHGKKKKKCHLQVAIFLSKRVNKMVYLKEFTFNGYKYINSFFKTRNIWAFENYCKKEGKFSIYDSGKSGSNLIYEELFNNKELTRENIFNIYKQGNKNDKRDFLMSGDKIMKIYNEFIKKPVLPEFKWIFPEHMMKFIEENKDKELDEEEEKLLEKYMFIIAWMKKFTNNEKKYPEHLRRQALVLYSPKRGVGKTTFALNIVPFVSDKLTENPFLIYNRNTINAQEFIKKKDTARLVILDDIKYSDNEKEMIKALLASEPTNIRTPYHNFMFTKSLPCIVMTNSEKIVKKMIKDNEFNTVTNILNLEYTYIGPKGTEPESVSRGMCIIGDKLENEIREEYDMAVHTGKMSRKYADQFEEKLMNREKLMEVMKEEKAEKNEEKDK